MHRPQRSLVIKLALTLAGSAVLLYAGLVFFSRWSVAPTPEMVRSFKTKFWEAFIPEAEDVRGHRVNLDVPMYMFSYRVPEAIPLESVLPSLATERGKYLPAMLTSTTLVLRSDYFNNEYHLILNPTTRRIGVLHMTVDLRTQEYHREMMKLLQRILHLNQIHGVRPETVQL